jgi:hypothetical protein
MTPYRKRELIKRIQKHRESDPDRAHVLLHSLVGIYEHTPFPVRVVHLEPFNVEFPELVKNCLKGCSQSGIARRTK